MKQEVLSAVKGGIAIDDRPKDFVPPTAYDLRLNLALKAMNQPSVQEKWKSVMLLLLNGFMQGHTVIETTVPEGGSHLLTSLGYCCANVQKVDGMERVSVSLEPVLMMSFGGAES